MTTNLTLHLSSAFLTEVTGSATGTGGTGTQGGSWAYLWNQTPPSDVPVSPLLASGATNNWTPLVLDSNLSSNVTFNSAHNDYEVQVALTDSSLGSISSSAVYLIVQSEDPASHTDLTLSTGIGSSVGNILPNTATWHYGYSAFEITLGNAPGDLGDLTAIPGFAWNMAVNIQYDNGTNQSRGLGVIGQTMTTTLTTQNAAAAVLYPTSTGTPFSPLDGQTSMVNSPSNSSFGPALYPTSAWSSYLSTVSTLPDMTLTGTTNGEPDANGVWHNGQYYSYTVSTQTLGTGAWGAAGSYFVFSPNADSQTQGYMLISAATLQSNLYAAGQGTMTIWQDSAFTTPYLVPGSAPAGQALTNAIGTSANNQWGNVLTPFFTGFTAGYWGTTSHSPNPMIPAMASSTNWAGGNINLDDTLNWAPAYAFDANRVGTVPSYQHNDFYTQQFFNSSNIYGSAFSDNLSVGLATGPLIPLSQPDGSQLNVSNIDLYAYGRSETSNPYFTPPDPQHSVYLPLAGGQTDYLPVSTATATTTGPQLIVSGQTAGLFPQSNLTVQLGLYQGGGQFQYVTLPSASNGNTGQVDYWQNYNLTNNGGTWTAISGGANLQGTFIINTLPLSTAATPGQIYWYQLVVTDTEGDRKVYNFYATEGTTVGTIDTPSSHFAADGGATLAPVSGQPAQMQLALNPAFSMPIDMLVFGYNSQFAATPAAPVVGVLSGGSFTSVSGQDSLGISNTYAASGQSDAPSVTLGTGGDLAFGWTGTNSYSAANYNASSSTPGWTTAFTNKIVATHIAMLTIKEGTTAIGHLQGTADLDGQWQTSTTTTLGDGTYTVSMQEYLADGTTIFGTGTSISAPQSALLTMKVALQTLTLQATPQGDGLAFAAHAALGPGGGNWLHFDPSAGSTLPQGSQLLLYATMNDGTLVGRDGDIGGSVSVQDATMARLGSMHSDGGRDLLKISQVLYLPDDQQLHFALLNNDGTINMRPGIAIAAQSDGSMLVSGAGLQFAAKVGNTVDHDTYLASDQRSSDQPIVYLTKGETIHVEVAGSADNANTIHFVRFDQDPNSGKLSVAGVAYGNTDAFRAAVQGNWDAGFAIQNGHGTFDVNQDWTVAGKSGFYAPVLVTQDGTIFVPGTANVDGRVHVQTFGENVFGFEDLRADQHADFDYNDMVVSLSVLLH